MKTTYLLELEAPDTGIGSRLAAAGALPASVDTLWTLSSDAVLDTACHILSRSRMRFRIFHHPTPTASDRASELNCYLSVAVLDVDYPRESRRCGLFRDVMASTVVGTRAAVDLLCASAPDIRFEPVGNRSGIFQMTHATDLPEPVIVPAVFASGKAADGVWAVQSDGRELLTDANRRVVRERGLVLAPCARLDNEIVRWRRPPVVSGEVWALLEANNVGGLMKPPPYLGPL